ITSFTPASSSSGNTVTITGTNFTGTTAVSFGGTAAASFTLVSDTEITAVIGAGSSGSVSVTNPQGTATRAGFIISPPVITSFSPASGPIGTTVTITGTKFNAAAANNIVFFGATRATVTAASTASLEVIV